MDSPPFRKLFLFLLLLPVLIFCGPINARAAYYPELLPELYLTGQTNDPLLRLSLHYQAQMQSLQQELQQKRQEAEQAAQRNAEALQSRLTSLEQSLVTQRQRETDTWRNVNREMLTISLIFGLVLLAGIGLVIWTHNQTVKTLTHLTEAFRSLPALSNYRPANGIMTLSGPDPVEQSSTEFLSRLERLQKRLNEVEKNVLTEALPVSNGHTAPSLALPSSPPAPAAAPADISKFRPPLNPAEYNATLIMAKGETFLKMDQPEKALACFDEALKFNPKLIDACVKKGQALEASRRFDEALQSYEHALELDGSLVNVYLLKGAVHNRLKQFKEALDCYDRALQPKRS